MSWKQLTKMILLGNEISVRFSYVTLLFQIEWMTFGVRNWCKDCFEVLEWWHYLSCGEEFQIIFPI